MLEKTIQSLQERIKGSLLKDVMAAELSDLIRNRPPGVPAEEYMTAAAVLIIRQLKSELTKDADLAALCDHSAVDAAPLDCETIVNGLLIGMHHDLLESNLQMVKALGSAIAERDYGTSEHNFRVTLYAVNLAESLSLEKAQIQGLIKGSFLHDIGKIGIRDKTLLKPGGLTRREYEDVKKHVTLGKQIVSSVRWLEDAIDIIEYHHEKWDGTGYPEGLSGEKIPLKARVFCIADVFDALTSERPYKAAKSYDETITTMTHQKSRHFDPTLLSKFTEISRRLYESITNQDVVALENAVLTAINRHFQFSSTVDDLRDSFGSIVQPGNNSD